MRRRSSFALTACLILKVVVALAGLSSCGGGGAPAREPMITPLGSREVMITPPGNRAPQAVGSIPAQTLTAGENASSVNVAPYFQDPDNDQLTYSASSNRPGALMAGMSGSTMTLTPVSAGATTVTVTSGDGNAHATQTIATTMQEPENTLTGIRVVLQNPHARETSMRILLEPADAQWSGINFEIDPDDNAGNMCCYQTFAESIYVSFLCSNSYTGNATITIIVSAPNGHAVQKSVSVTCR